MRGKSVEGRKNDEKIRNIGRRDEWNKMRG